MKLSGRVALITGAGSGIGRATALLFAKEGAAVTVADISDDGGRETVARIEQIGGRGLFVHTDVSLASQVEAAIEATVGEFGRLDILHNNAFSTVPRAILDTTEEEWDRTLAVCLKGPFLGAKYAIPHMLKNGAGVIINTASVHGIRGVAGWTAYQAAKGGLLSLTRSLAADCAPNIRVNAILPGGVKYAGPSDRRSGRGPGVGGENTDGAFRGAGGDRRGGPVLGQRRFLICHGRGNSRGRRTVLDTDIGY